MGNAEHRTQNAECKTQNTERRTQNEKNFDVLSSEFDVLSSCRLCPRACGADRLVGQFGYCRAGVLPRVFRYGAHFGEEPPQIIPIRDLKNLDTYTKHFLLKTPELPSTVDRVRTSSSEHRTQNVERRTSNAEHRTQNEGWRMGNAEHRTQNAECKTQNTERRTQNEKNFDVLSSEFDVLSSCRLCPRACGADRLAGQLGYCRAGVLPRVFRYGAHFGEEPPITGTRGSGTVFFSHCTMRCIYCQNHPWSQAGHGDDLTVEVLRDILAQLARQGCHNWNLVSPTPWLPQIREAAKPLLRAGIALPFVYNTSGYESLETLEAFADLADIALIDLRYARAESAAEGSDARTYVEAARGALRWFWERLGPLETDASGIAVRGVICRILALPGRIAEAVENLEWLARHTGSGIHVSVMSQYTPLHRALQTPGWDRKVSADEYAVLVEAAEDLGLGNGWIQEFEGEAPADLLGQNMPAGEGAVGAGSNTPA